MNAPAFEIDAFDAIFFPYATDMQMRVVSTGTRFVYYTTAEVAASILSNQEIWMRNATTLNDFSEIEYGIECLAGAWNSSRGEEFKKALDSIFPTISATIEKKFNEWQYNIRTNTFLTCISEHDESEDKYGRLSMWRAYGGDAGVALVVNNDVFRSDTDALNIYSSPVAYFTPEKVSNKLFEITNLVLKSRDLVRSRGMETTSQIAFNMLQFAAMSTKHPGFHEEREWRIIHTPSFGNPTRLVRAVETIRGIPQIVLKIPLRNEKAAGLDHMELPQLIERIIIGPTEHPFAIRDALHNLMQAARINNPEKKLVISDIPLRKPS